MASLGYKSMLALESNCTCQAPKLVEEAFEHRLSDLAGSETAKAAEGTRVAVCHASAAAGVPGYRIARLRSRSALLLQVGPLVCWPPRYSDGYVRFGAPSRNNAGLTPNMREMCAWLASTRTGRLASRWAGGA
jgi:hypothetical protein